MRVLTSQLFRNDYFALIRKDIIIFVTIVKAQNDAICLTIIKYNENRSNNFKAVKKTEGSNMKVLTLKLIRNEDFALIHLDILTFLAIVKV